MPSFGVTLPHSLGKETAMVRLREFITQFHAQHQDKVRNIEQRWEGDILIFSFVTTGMKVSGTVGADEETAHVKGQLPFAAVLFRGQIEREIRSQLEQLLS